MLLQSTTPLSRTQPLDTDVHVTNATSVRGPLSPTMNYALEGDGVVTNVYYFAWKYSQHVHEQYTHASSSQHGAGGKGGNTTTTRTSSLSSTQRLPTPLMVPSTVIVEHGYPKAWYSTADGSSPVGPPVTLLDGSTVPAPPPPPSRRLGREVDVPHVLREFLEATRHGPELDALYRRHQQDSIHQRQQQGESGGMLGGGAQRGSHPTVGGPPKTHHHSQSETDAFFASHFKDDHMAACYFSMETVEGRDCASVEYLDGFGLRQLLQHRTRRPQGFIQRWVNPGDKHNAVVQLVWTPTTVTCTRRVNKFPVRLTTVPMYERALTFEGDEAAPHVLSTDGHVVSPGLEAHLRAVTNDFIAYLLTYHHVSIKRMVFHFKVDEQGIPWFLWCSSVRTQSHVPVSMSYPFVPFSEVDSRVAALGGQLDDRGMTTATIHRIPHKPSSNSSITNHTGNSAAESRSAANRNIHARADPRVSHLQRRAHIFRPKSVAVAQDDEVRAMLLSNPLIAERLVPKLALMRTRPRTAPGLYGGAAFPEVETVLLREMTDDLRSPRATTTTGKSKSTSFSSRNQVSQPKKRGKKKGGKKKKQHHTPTPSSREDEFGEVKSSPDPSSPPSRTHSGKSTRSVGGGWASLEHTTNALDGTTNSCLHGTVGRASSTHAVGSPTTTMEDGGALGSGYSSYATIPTARLNRPRGVTVLQEDDTSRVGSGSGFQVSWSGAQSVSPTSPHRGVGGPPLTPPTPGSPHRGGGVGTTTTTSDPFSNVQRSYDQIAASKLAAASAAFPSRVRSTSVSAGMLAQQSSTMLRSSPSFAGSVLTPTTPSSPAQPSSSSGTDKRKLSGRRVSISQRASTMRGAGGGPSSFDMLRLYFLDYFGAGSPSSSSNTSRSMIIPTMYEGVMDPSSGGRSQPHMTSKMRWEWLRRLVVSGWVREMSAVRSFREACEGLLYECYSDSVHNPHQRPLQHSKHAASTPSDNAPYYLPSSSSTSASTPAPFVSWPHAHSLRLGAILRPAMAASHNHHPMSGGSVDNHPTTFPHVGLTIPSQIVCVVRMLLRSRSARRRPYNSTTSPLPYFKEATAALEARGIDVHGCSGVASVATNSIGHGRTPSPLTSPHRRGLQPTPSPVAGANVGGGGTGGKRTASASVTRRAGGGGGNESLAYLTRVISTVLQGRQKFEDGSFWTSPPWIGSPTHHSSGVDSAIDERDVAEDPMVVAAIVALFGKIGLKLESMGVDTESSSSPMGPSTNEDGNRRVVMSTDGLSCTPATHTDTAIEGSGCTAATTTTPRHRIGTPLCDYDDDGVVPFPTRRRSSGASSNMLDNTAKFAEGLGAILGTPSSKAPTPYSDRTPRRSITDQQQHGETSSLSHTDDPSSSAGVPLLLPTMADSSAEGDLGIVSPPIRMPPYTFRFAGCTRPLYEAQAINIPQIVDQVVPPLLAALKWEAVTARWIARRNHFIRSDGTNTPSD